MNDQRKVVYEQRLELITAPDVADTVKDMREQVLDDLVARHVPENAYPEQWDVEQLHADMTRYLALDLPVADWAKEEGITQEEVKRRLVEASDRKVAHKIATYGEPMMRMAEKSLLLQILDHLWKEHLLHLDHLRQGIHLRGYGQRDPLNEYKSEAFALFDALLGNLRLTVTQVLSHLEIRLPEPEPEPPPPEAAPQPAPTRARALAMAGAGEEDASVDPRDPSTWGKVPRNAPCPCGSGRKYKQCHGRLA
jgi:preprotein translocase subunit SecA